MNVVRIADTFIVTNDFEMYCTKKNSHTFHLNICEKWKMKR